MQEKSINVEFKEPHETISIYTTNEGVMLVWCVSKARQIYRTTVFTNAISKHCSICKFPSASNSNIYQPVKEIHQAYFRRKVISINSSIES